MRIRSLLYATAIAALILPGTSMVGQAGKLRAGAAKVDISPPASMFPIKDMQEYGSLHDPLYARALVLDNGLTRVALISVDAIAVPFGSELIKAATDELRISPENLMLNATHDHNTPLAGGGFGPGGAGSRTPYFEILKKGVLEAARQAAANLQPARIGFGKGKAYINTNRDEKIGEGYHMGYNPDGSSDKTVSVLLVTKPDGEPIAMDASYAVHSVVMFRAHTKDGHVQVTGDLGGAAARYVEDHFKGAVALWTMAAAGDQNPLFMANYNQDAPDVHDEGPDGWAILDVLSRRVGEEIVRVSTNIRNTSDRVILWGAQTSVTCAGQRRAEPPAPGVPTGGYLAPAQVKMVDGDPVTIPLQIVMINDIAIQGISGELFTEIGEHIRRDSIFDRMFMVTMLPNGIGYIPTDKAYLLPSEKAIANRIKPGCAEVGIVGAFQKMQQSYLPVFQAVTK